MTDKKKFNLFGTVLTHSAPSCNYRGESEENRTVIQKITKGNHEYAVVSPEAMRNALRETLAKYGLKVNRSRLHQEDQLAVEFESYPDASSYADDFLFGYFVAKTSKTKDMKTDHKRDSVLRMNLAVGLQPYRFNATFHQSPLNAGKSPWKNSSSSALLHREVTETDFQYPFALSVADCFKQKKGPEWAASLLKAIGELNNVAGGHARSYFEFAPRSIVVRLTPCLVAGYQTYCFNDLGDFSDLGRVRADDLAPAEFWIGGEVVRQMPAAEQERLRKAGARLYSNPQTLLSEVSKEALGVTA